MFVAGAYTVTLGGTTIGQVEDGIRLRYSTSVESIRGDNYGDTVQDGVFRGLSDFMYLDMVLTEYNLALAQSAFWYWSATFGTIADGTVGKLLTALAQALVMTKVSGPNAVPTSLTANLAILAPGNSVELLFAPRLRRVPLSLVLLPFNSSTNKFFTLA